MSLHIFLSIALLAVTTVAKPAAHIPFFQHQSANTSIPAITMTASSADLNMTTTIDPGLTCVAIPTATPGSTCNDIASQHGIQLSAYESSSPAGSAVCHEILAGHGICIALRGSAIASLLPLSTSNVTLGTNTSASNTSFAGVSTTTTMTTSETTTLTYTNGTATSVVVRTVVETHTATDVFAVLTTVRPSSSLSAYSSPNSSSIFTTSNSSITSGLSANGSSSAISTSASSLVNSSTITISGGLTTGAATTNSTPVTTTVTSTSSQALATATGSSVDVYKMYTGDGSLADGWPAQSEWVKFDDMFEANTAMMKASCAQWAVPDDSDNEVANVKKAIQSIANSTRVDARLILAVVMQESTGCVRVITTQYSVYNPGLMQSHNGTGTCNTNNAALGISNKGVVQTPCPYSEIRQQIEDGTAGTSSGNGLKQCLQQQGHTDVSRFYRAARMYNGGGIDPSGDLGKGCCTACYASDIANRLTGWVNAPHDCTL